MRLLQPEPPPESEERAALRRGLEATLQLQHVRSARLASVRRLAAASAPIWLRAHFGVLPAPLAWLAFLLQGSCLALAATYAALEHRWARRVARLPHGGARVAVHARWSEWDEVRSALWFGLALVSSVPWMYVGFGRPVPPRLLAALGATGWTVLLLLAVAEGVAALRAWRGARPRRAGPGAAPERPWRTGTAG